MVRIIKPHNLIVFAILGLRILRAKETKNITLVLLVSEDD